MTPNDLKNALRRAAQTPARPSSDYDLNPDFQLPEGRVLRDAAVLIAFQKRPGGIDLLLTKRASTMKHHPGQIAFPGGKQDPGDRTLVDCALRESAEEVGLASDQIKVLGELRDHETVTGFRVRPVLGWISDTFDPVPEEGEVDEAFFIPADHVLNPACFQVQSRYWRRQRRHYYTVPYGPYYIWGATARMLRALADQVAE